MKLPLWMFTAVVTGFSGWKSGNALHSWPSFMILAVICGRYFLSAAFQTLFSSSSAKHFLFLNCKSRPWCFLWLCATGAYTGSQQAAMSRTDGIFGKSNYPKGSCCIAHQGLHAYRLVSVLRESQGGVAVVIDISNAQAVTGKINSLPFMGCSRRKKPASHQWLSVLAPADCWLLLLSPCSFHWGLLQAAAPLLMLEALYK